MTSLDTQKCIFLLNKKISVINASSIKDLEDKRDAITDLFFRTLRLCDYDRSLITSGSFLEKVLDPAVHASHYQSDSVDPLTGKRIDETVKEALFSLRLGVKPERAYSKYHKVSSDIRFIIFWIDQKND